MTWHVLPGAPAIFTQTRIPEAALSGIQHVNGDGLVVVKHTLDSWRAMMSRGLIAPSPMHLYDWPGPHQPWRHQVETAEFLIRHEWCGCWSSMGTGKTSAALWAADYLMSQGDIERAVIVAPLSVCSHVWQRELFTAFPHRKTAFAYGSRAKRQQIVRSDHWDFLIVNHDGLKLIKEDLKLAGVGLIIYDEATAVKAAQSARWRTLHGLREGRKLWLMSGTPTPQSPTDAYGLMCLLHEHRPMTFTAWKSLTMEPATRFRWTPKGDADQTVARWLQPAIRFSQQEVFDVQYQSVPVDLTPEQMELIAHLKERAHAEMSGAAVTVANAAALISKILQVQCGGVYATDENGDRVSRAVPAGPFFAEVVRAVEQADTPVLIFVPFTAAAEAIHAAVVGAGFPAGLVTGATRQSARAPIFDAFLAGDLRAIVAVPETMAHGLTLTVARTVVWAMPTFKAESYTQANGRVIRPGQKNGVVIQHLVTSPLVRSLYARLRDKGARQDNILSLLESAMR